MSFYNAFLSLLAIVSLEYGSRMPKAGANIVWGGSSAASTEAPEAPPVEIQQDEYWGYYPSSPPDIPREFILTNASTYDIAHRLSAPAAAQENYKRTIIFTTLRFGDAARQAVLDMVSNFCYYLHNQSLLQHTMLLTTDPLTWKTLRFRGFPAYLDRSFPRRSGYVDHVLPNDTYNREFDVQKHFWGWRFASLGFRVVYMDSDAAVFGDLLAPFSHPFHYDVQGLTDWEYLEDPQMQRAFTLNVPCSLYRLAPDDSTPSKAMWTETWNIPRNITERPLLVPNPCQSTGIWFLEPTAPTVEFMRAVLDRIAYHHVYEWDQTAWNDVILHFLWGTGEYEPLKYRALPFEEFSNYLTWKTRGEKGFPQASIVLHMGGIHGAEKQVLFQKHNLWHGNFTWEQDQRHHPKTNRIVELLLKKDWMRAGDEQPGEGVMTSTAVLVPTIGTFESAGAQRTIFSAFLNRKRCFLVHNWYFYGVLGAVAAAAGGVFLLRGQHRYTSYRWWRRDPKLRQRMHLLSIPGRHST